jgi:aryl-alcohol dehydrogenase-like predicted oxidoreductase
VLKTVELGRTGMRISRVGLGAWAIGGTGWWDAWGAQDDDESIATIRRAAELGINWVDTAPIYGLGHSEEVVGRALEGLDPRPFVFTKAGLLDGGDGSVRNNLSRDSLLREIELSLRRLRLDVIDLYQVHWPIPDERLEEAWAVFAELKKQGLVRHIGGSNFSVEQMRRVEAIAPVETLQPPYSLLERGIEEEILPFTAEEDIGVLVYSPQASGLLSGRMTAERVAALPEDDWRRRDPRFNEELPRHLQTVDRLRAVGERHGGAPPGAIAIAWTLRDPAVHGSIVGFRRPGQVEELASAGDIELSADDLAAIGADTAVR